MKDEEIYNKVKEEVNLLILETYEGMSEYRKYRPAIMLFVEKAIAKTLRYKNELNFEKLNESLRGRRIKMTKEEMDQLINTIKEIADI